MRFLPPRRGKLLQCSSTRKEKGTQPYGCGNYKGLLFLNSNTFSTLLHQLVGQPQLQLPPQHLFYRLVASATVFFILHAKNHKLINFNFL